MNKIKFLAILAIAAFSNIANAQSTTSASATATIVTPIAITKVTDMNFGNVAVSSTAGTVILSSAGTRTKSGGVTLPVVAGTVAAASFNVIGNAGYAYSIAIPSDITLTIFGGGETMAVTSINNNIGTTGIISSVNGTQNILVGGTLNVAAGQVAGVYSNASALTVTVNYN